MCARFSLYATPAQIAKLLDVEVPDTAARYNIAPTQMVLGAIEKEGKRQLREFRWGLIPSWATDASVGNRMINARSEGLLEKASFRNAFMRRRCVIPASGFFEWKHEVLEEKAANNVREGAPSLFDEFEVPKRSTKKKTVKQPYFLALKSREPFALAGLYEYWRDPLGEMVRSCTILTTHPNELVEPLHDRMPVILRREDLESWLDCEHHDPVDVRSLLEPVQSSDMVAIPVSTLVNDPANETAAILTGVIGG